VRICSSRGGAAAKMPSAAEDGNGQEVPLLTNAARLVAVVALLDGRLSKTRFGCNRIRNHRTEPSSYIGDMMDRR
jgi:hypothetical protein